MRARGISSSVLFCTLLTTAMFTADVTAQDESRRSRGRGLYGDWLIRMDFNGRQFESILSFSRDSEGKRTAQWISFRGISDLKDLKLEDGNLSFVRERQNRDGETTTSTFKGTIKDGKLSGVLASDRGETKLEGERRRRMPRAVGSWELKFKVGDREITNTLVVKVGKKDELLVDWKSERVTHKITDAKYERGKLSFKTQSKMDDRQWESTFEGTIRGDTLSAASKSDQGEIKIEGKKAAAPLVGTWILELTSERGNRKQRLLINPDMSGLYGTTAVKKVSLADGKVSFDVVFEFGENKFEMGFKGTVKESKLSGELTTSRGTTKVTGTKVVRRRRGRRETI
jgi:hypothetical protein